VPKKCYANPAKVQVEADASSATYPLAIAAITGGCVTADTVGKNSIQVTTSTSASVSPYPFAFAAITGGCVTADTVGKHSIQ